MAKKPATKKKVGRPSTYTEELGFAVCQRIAEGESVRAICRDEAMPDRHTIYNWANDPNHPFHAHYARACELRADYFAGRITEIAEEVVTDRELDPQAARVAIDAYKWTAARMSKRWCDKITQEHTGPGGGGVVFEIVRGTPPKGNSD